MVKADIGLIGLAAMGENLALNMERNGFCVAVYNRTPDKIDNFVKGQGAGKNFIGCYNIEELCQHVKTPRKIMLLIKAGNSVDLMIKQIGSHLDPDDIIIDAGNSHFKDTIRRQRMIEDENLRYMGIGVSGGVEGALKGPSIMPGGSKGAWDEVKAIFQSISAKSNGKPCCQYMGPNGAGHFVKMVHNGIEYSNMQLIADSYFLLKTLLELDIKQLQAVFEKWNQGDLNSYLIEITKNIMSIEDSIANKPLLDLILDTGGQKGTGKWTSQTALEIGVPIPSVSEAVFARFISALKDERIRASEQLKGPKIQYNGDIETLVESIRKALYASLLCSYAQGFTLLKGAEKEYGWKFNFSDITHIWRKGCIIQAKILEKIKIAYSENPELENLLNTTYFNEIIGEYQEAWRNVTANAIKSGIPVPGFSSTLTYYDSYRNPRLPTNLIQAQRDYFGAHTYERVDKPRGNFFHYDKWPELE